MKRRLAPADLKMPERLAELGAPTGQGQGTEQRSVTDAAIAVRYAIAMSSISRHRIGESVVDLAHTAIDIQSTSDKPGAGQQQMSALRDLKKLRLQEDDLDSPTYIRDRTPLKKGQITTLRCARNSGDPVC
jgi:hypothetical protein